MEQLDLFLYKPKPTKNVGLGDIFTYEGIGHKVTMIFPRANQVEIYNLKSKIESQHGLRWLEKKVGITLEKKEGTLKKEEYIENIYPQPF